MKIFRLIGAGAAVSMALSGPAMADGLSMDSFYVGAALGWDYSTYDSGGTNTLGAFGNDNDGSGGSAMGSFFAGFDDLVSFGPVTLRAEVEGMLIGKKNIITDSFLPPNPTFFYRTEVRSYAGLVNLWADVRPFAEFPVVLSAGGGVGIAHHEIETTDLVVSGDGSDTTFAYALGVQAAYEFSPTVSAGVMGRYTDFGTPEINLTSVAGNVPSGNYSLDQSGAQVMGFIRFHFGAD